MIMVELRLEEVFRDPVAKKEFLGWAMSDSDFLESFLVLLSEGISPEGSWPNRLSEIKEEFFKQCEKPVLATSEASAREANVRAKEAMGRVFELELKMSDMKKLLSHIAVDHDGVTELKHDGSLGGTYCPACKFLRLAKGTEE